jgi:hypothetical protein
MTGSQEASLPLGGIYWQLVFLGTCGFSFVTTTSSLFLKEEMRIAVAPVSHGILKHATKDYKKWHTYHDNSLYCSL